MTYSSSKAARWAADVHPGPPSSSSASRARTRATSPVPTVYPESSVSNPYASRYTGRPSRPRSVSVGHQPSAHYAAPSRASTRHTSASGSRHSSRGTTPMETQTIPMPRDIPVVARSRDPDGRDSYIILPPKGSTVEILSPRMPPVRSNSTPPESWYRGSSSSSTTPRSPTKEKPLFRRLFDKVDWSSDKEGRSRSRSRSNSVEGGNWTVVSGGSTRSYGGGSQRGSVTTVTSGSKKYNIVRV